MSPRVVVDTLHGDESSPLHYVVPFNHTGYIRNVAGGRLPPLRTHRLVIPFIRTGCIRGVSGTAHRPFPTVSLEGLFFQPSRFKNVRFLTRRDKRYNAKKRRIVNCQLSIVNSKKLSTVNCQLLLPPSPPNSRPIPRLWGRIGQSGCGWGSPGGPGRCVLPGLLLVPRRSAAPGRGRGRR